MKTNRAVEHTQIGDFREARLADDDQWILTLRDGTKMDGRAAAATLSNFARQFRIERPTLEMMYDYVMGNGDLSEEFREREAHTPTNGILTPEGDLPEHWKIMLRNAFEKTDTGLQSVNPFGDDAWTATVVNTVLDNRPIFEGRFRQELRDARKRREDGTDEPDGHLR